MDPITRYIPKVDPCPSCNWIHEGEETFDEGEPVYKDIYEREYYICQLTLQKVYL